MSKINIGGFDLDSSEIIDVTYTEIWYTRLFNAMIGLMFYVGVLVVLNSILMLTGIILDDTFIWRDILIAIFLFLLAFTLIFFKENQLEEILNKFEITVKTMSNGEIKIHKKVFDEYDYLDYYEELKTYI